jgi:endo-1,4-beta-xylanase
LQNEQGECKWKKTTLRDNKILKVGTLITGKQLNTKEGTDIYKTEFNSGLIDYQTEWFFLEPERGIYDYSGDRQINFANNQEMEVIAQHLIWGGASPDWLISGGFSRDEYISIMSNHIIRTMKYFQGRVDAWSVVNEARTDTPGYDFWARKIGPTYIDLAFQTARETDPSAKLLYSDLGNETPNGPTTEISYSIVERLKSKGLIDGLAMHMRIDASKSPTKDVLIKTMQLYDIPIYITELTVDLTNIQGSQQDRLFKQAEIYKSIIEAAIESDVCVTFDMFGIGDSANYLEVDLKKLDADPTIYTDSLEPKPAYYVLLQSLIENSFTLR